MLTIDTRWHLQHYHLETSVLSRFDHMVMRPSDSSRVKTLDYELGYLTLDMDLVKWRKFRSYSCVLKEFNSTDILRRLVTILYDDICKGLLSSQAGFSTVKSRSLSLPGDTYTVIIFRRPSVRRQGLGESYLLLGFWSELNETLHSSSKQYLGKIAGSGILIFCLSLILWGSKVKI